MLVCWSAGRVAYLAFATGERDPVAVPAQPGVSETTTAVLRTAIAATVPLERRHVGNPRPFEPPMQKARPAARMVSPRVMIPRGKLRSLPARTSVTTQYSPQPQDAAQANTPLPVPSSHRRLLVPVSGSAWVLYRPEARGLPLGSTGQLGGSQAGFRLIAPMTRSGTVRASIRASYALQSPHQAELAPGVSLKPLSGVPVELIAERRLRLSRGSKDATAMLLAGGTTLSPKEAWEASLYAQAGAVGLNNPQLFADGAATLRRAITPSGAIGVGAWGGIQPGLNRIDIGPTGSMLIGTRAGAIRLTVDGRIRVAGNARPGSGIAITLAKDF